MSRVVVTLSPIERRALIDYALKEVRTPRDQARWIITQELIRRGYLEAEETPLATLDVMDHNARHTK
jgi:hypothetical protein